MRIGPALLFTLSAFCFGILFQRASAQQNQALTSLSPCVIDLKVPRFGPGAYADGETDVPIVSLIEIGQGGRLTTVKFRGGKRGHRSEIERFLRSSTFSSSCAGRHVEIQFSYRIEGPTGQYHTLWIEFKPPNHFVIFTNPRAAIID